MRATVFVGVSVDGFIAREDGGIDWLTAQGNPMEDAEDFGYHAFFDSVDVLVMGRHTFELVRTFDPWPYGDKPVVVLTTRGVEIPPELAGRVRSMAGEPREIVDALAKEGADHLYVDGGRTVQAFLAEGLIQRLIITRVPVLIGRGIPLFGPVPQDVLLRHVSTRAYEGGAVQTEYEVRAWGS